MSKWDARFLQVAQTIAEWSPCLTRKHGAILVFDKTIIATGYNGPARGVRHCEGSCTRRRLGFGPGEGRDYCPATHAEQNCIANAARSGVNTTGATLFGTFSTTPCKVCLGILINAGISEVVCLDIGPYDRVVGVQLEDSGIKLRTYNL